MKLNALLLSLLFFWVAAVNSRAQCPPSSVGSLKGGPYLLQGASSVYVSGNYAYVTSSTANSLSIVDVSNPANPLIKGYIVDGTGGAKLNYPLSIYVSGNYAYVASYNSNALEIVDVTNPTSPFHKGSLASGTGGAKLNSPMSVYVSGNYAYVVSAALGALEVVDITDPANPTHAGSLINGTGGAKLNSPESVYISGNYAYVASNGSGALEIIDVSNPAGPVHAGSLANGSGGAKLAFPRAVYVQGNYAYVVSIGGGGTLEIVDIANPVAPVHKGSLVSGSGGASLASPSSIYVSGNYAYVASSNSNALEIVDVTNPANPLHKGSLGDGNGGASLGEPYSIFVLGNSAYIASIGSAALEIADIANPASPVHKGSLANPALPQQATLSGAFAVYVSEGYAYVSSHGSNSLEIIDVTSPTSPAHKGVLMNGAGGALLDRPFSVYISGSYAYVASFGSNALEIVDVTDPANPVHKGSLADGTDGAMLHGPTGVYVSGSYAFVASYLSNAIEVVDITNPASPKHKGLLADGTGGAMLSGAYSVYVSGNYAYVTSRISNALEVIDITDPASPVHAGALVDGTGGAKLNDLCSLVVSGNYAYIASNGSNALEIVDITTPANPTHKSFLVDGTNGAKLINPGAISVSGNYAYLTSYGSNALEIVDITDPAMPVHSGSLVDGSTSPPLLSGPQAVYVGDYVYVASNASNESSSGSFEVISITPGTPGVNITQPTCSLSTGTITISSPAPGYQYSFDGGSTFGTAVSANGLVADAYTVIAQSSPGCNSEPVSIVLNASVVPSAPTLKITQPNCVTSTGTITIDAPVPGYQYSFDGGTTFGATTNASELSANTYYVLAQSNSGCSSAPASVVMNGAPVVPPVPATIVTQPTCTTITGMIAIDSPVPDYQYSFDGGATFGTATNASGLSANTYYIVALSNSGCNSTPASAMVNSAPPIPSAPSTIVTQPTCTTSTGMITIDGPVSGYQYSFDGGITFGTATNAGGLSAGTYQIVSKSSPGCLSIVVNTEINVAPVVPGQPILTVDLANPASPVLTSSSATAYEWFNNGTPVDGATSQSLTVTGPGDYTVVVFSDAGCASQPSLGKAIVVTAITELASNRLIPHPNPSTTTFSLDLSDDITSFQVFSSGGSEVNVDLVREGDKYQFGVGQLSPGMYVLNLFCQGNRYWIKFIKR